MSSKFFLEAGLNHFGDINEAKKILNFFLKSSFKNLSFMLHTKNFYEEQKIVNNLNFFLENSFYINALKLAHKKNKKIGLAICDEATFDKLKDINFDFYKILGLAINNFPLLKRINKKKKHTFISLAQGSDYKIKNCLKYFPNKKKTHLIYTSMSYDPSDINLSRISYIRKKFNISVGYGHHYKNINTLILSCFYNPEFYFIYIKRYTNNKKKVYPDNDHAFFFYELDDLVQTINECRFIAKNKKINTMIKLDVKKIKK